MRWLWILVFFATIWAPARAAPLAEQYMDGRIGQGEQALSQHLLVRPDDDQARFRSCCTRGRRRRERWRRGRRTRGR